MERLAGAPEKGQVMAVQRTDIAELFQLAAANDWETFQQRLRRLSLSSTGDVVQALGILQETEREDERKAATAHMVADDLVLRYIDNADITRAFYGVHR